MTDKSIAAAKDSPTPTHTALLRLVADSCIRREWRYDRGEKEDISIITGRTVTDQVAELHAAGWVGLESRKHELSPVLEYSSWRLTELGRRVMDRADDRTAVVRRRQLLL